MAAVEFALMLPLFLVLFAAIIDFGRALTVRQELATAVHEASRVGAARACPRPTTDAITAIVNANLAGSGLNPAGTVVQVTRTGNEIGDLLTVKVQYPSDFSLLSAVTPLLASIGGGGAFSGPSLLSVTLVSELQ